MTGKKTAKKPQKKPAAKKTFSAQAKNAKHKKQGKTKRVEKTGAKKALPQNIGQKGGQEQKPAVTEFSAELPADKVLALRSFETILHPLVTEKSIGMIESENKLVFVVDSKAQKETVKKAVEGLYRIKVDKVNILRDMKGRKRAFVKINRQFRADEIATKLGVL